MGSIRERWLAFNERKGTCLKLVTTAEEAAGGDPRSERGRRERRFFRRTGRGRHRAGSRSCTPGIATRDSIRQTRSAPILATRRISTISTREVLTCTSTREAGAAVVGTGGVRREEASAGSSADRVAAGLAVPLEQGDLRWLTLDLIAAQPRHGYEIIKAIEDALSGHYTPSPGVIYPTLTLLEETGLIVGEAQGSKKLYRLTDEGRAEVEAHAADIRAARSRLQEANTRFGGSPAPELFRAMNNLHAALQVRLAKGELSADALGASPRPSTARRQRSSEADSRRRTLRLCRRPCTSSTEGL